ncbi:molybdenum cofactor synthesis domain containing protein [Caldicellulosiruptor saccharolyticus DSM 8903]|uniref:Molybdopterin molybdenumtransferase n=1 Tax=Caldicellulosiruptor saccharolyticus (strain ATCC 43494 / DSM 8903 / Tp8T 6331) TaxID=351627 RepID=A4XI55_CALS8|nr:MULTISPECIES: molybdopterin molybdotransferase MoeA [Caldicellulosiruptor]ABP66590.1 molybdenum cofactor synthesis domain containing protein [Caldicellulosiruptor saccharolyticus DSM 8903]
MKDYHFSATLPQDARNIIEKILKEYLSLKTETISVYKAHGKFAAKDYLSLNTSPPTDVAAMDGYAINAEQTFNTTDANPAIIENFKVVQTGESIEGFDAVVPFEEAQVENGRIKIFQSYYPRQNVRSKGEDVQKEQLLIKKGDLLTIFDKVYLKAGGYLEVEVYKMPKVAFLPTGEELVDIVEKEGQLVEFNSVIFNDLLQRYGFEVGIFKPVENNLKKLTEKIKELLQEFDIVFVNAGSSKGDKDLTVEAISALGEVLVHGIAIKPGKPTIIGKVENKLVIGLPGFPVSMFFVLREIFLRPFFKTYNLNPKEKSIFATLERRLSSDIGSEEYVRVSIKNIDGKNVAKVLKRGASVISSLKRADGYVTVPINVDLIEEGSLIEVKLI